MSHLPKVIVANFASDPTKVVLDASQQRHLLSSLRLAKGDKLEVVDAESLKHFVCEISSIQDNVLSLENCTEVPAPNPSPITLLVGIPSGEVSETIVQKAVELGTSAVYFFASERTKGMREDA